ncbi:hypothetical protein PMAYCL1PPCAC_28340, partial [Pristionchus mayeri]
IWLSAISSYRFSDELLVVGFTFQLQSPEQKIALTISELVLPCNIGRMIIRDGPSINSPGFDVLGETSHICPDHRSFNPLTLESTGNAIFMRFMPTYALGSCCGKIRG